jgi:hypothetical protein|eukprot:COSAG06_NODE_288_length_18224_cov_8.849948_20_plen_92_part_00
MCVRGPAACALTASLDTSSRPLLHFDVSLSDRAVLLVLCSADTSVGDETCHGGWSPGSYNHWKTDADTFASWGVDCEFSWLCLFETLSVRV